MKFPTDRLRVTHVAFDRQGPDASLTLTLAPFEMTFDGNTETVETVARFDGIDLPETSARALENQSFPVPVNPEEGYIDGSIYLSHAHHPVDVTDMTFGPISGDHLPVTLTTRMVLSFEGLPGYDDTDWITTVNLPVAAFD